MALTLWKKLLKIWFHEIFLCKFCIFPNYACVWNSKANLLFWNWNFFTKNHINSVRVVLIDSKNHFAKNISYIVIGKRHIFERIQNFLQILSYFRTLHHFSFKVTLFKRFWRFLLQKFNFTFVILAFLTIFRLFPKRRQW